MRFVPLANRHTDAPSIGYYIIKSGNCISQVGTSSHVIERLYALSRLEHHRSSSKILCAAYCTKQAPVVGWVSSKSIEEARSFEARDKRKNGLPPYPKEYEGCRNGAKLRHDLIMAAGEGTWEAGYINAVFDIGEDFKRLKDPRFDLVWEKIGGWPPGPWNDTGS